MKLNETKRVLSFLTMEVGFPMVDWQYGTDKPPVNHFLVPVTLLSPDVWTGIPSLACCGCTFQEIQGQYETDSRSLLKTSFTNQPSCKHLPLVRPLPALRLRPGVSLAVDQLGLLRLEGGRARDVVRVEGEHVDPVAVALQRPAQRAVRRAPHLDGAVLRGQIRVVQGLR